MGFIVHSDARTARIRGYKAKVEHRGHPKFWATFFKGNILYFTSSSVSYLDLEPPRGQVWSSNPRKETARHEYFFSWLQPETVVGRKLTRGGLF